MSEGGMAAADSGTGVQAAAAGVANSGGTAVESGGGAEAVLERRYRRLLVLLPKAYRAERGEEMLTVLMDGAPQHRRWPQLGQTLSLATHGIKIRSGLSAEGVPPGAARPLVRAVALLGTAYLSILSAVGLAMGLRWNWGVYHSDFNHSDLDGHHHAGIEIGLVQVSGLLWLAACLALLLGWRRVVRTLGLVLFVASATQVTGAYTALAAVPPLIIATAVIVTGRRRIEPAPHLRWRFGALAVAAAGVAYLRWFGHGTFMESTAIGPLAAVAVAIAAVGALRAWRSAEWVLAAAAVGAVAAGQRALDINHYPPYQGGLDDKLGLVLIGEAMLVLIALFGVIRQRRSVVADGDGGGGGDGAQEAKAA